MKAFFQRAVEALDRFQQGHVWLSLPIAVLRKFSNDQGGSFSALIAYYGFLSVFPLLLAFAAVLGFVLAGRPGLQSEVLHTVEASFPTLSGYIDKAVSGSNAALGVGLAGALWGGLGVTLATERAMNSIWDIPFAERPNLWVSRLRAVGMLGVLGVTFLLSTALSGLRGVGGPLALPAVIAGTLGPLLLNFALYLLAFQVLTNLHVGWSKLLPGAVIGALGWTALQSLGTLYVRHEVAHASRLYGSLAVVVGLLAWIYLGARLTLLAAEANAVLALRLWPRSLRATSHTEADRRAFARQAREVARGAGEEVTVSFGELSALQGTDVVTPQVVRAGVTASVGPTSEAKGVHDIIAVTVAHLEEYGRLRQRLGLSDDAAERRALVDRLGVEARSSAQALAALAREEKAFELAMAQLRR